MNSFATSRTWHATQVTTRHNATRVNGTVGLPCGTHRALKRRLGDEQVRRLLVLADLPERERLALPLALPLPLHLVFLSGESSGESSGVPFGVSSGDSFGESSGVSSGDSSVDSSPTLSFQDINDQ